MKLYLITQPFFFDKEVSLVNEMFACGLEVLHLRKPEAALAEMENFLSKIDAEYLKRISIHSCYDLVGKYGLRGAHLGRNRSLDLCDFHGKLSFSCHTLEEVIVHKPICDYVFLSPVFDSISKQGYKASFSDEVLAKAKEDGIIDSKVVALGGISLDNVARVGRMGFGGVAVLGGVWQSSEPVRNLEKYLQVLDKL